jgi:hypothetical protein
MVEGEGGQSGIEGTVTEWHSLHRGTGAGVTLADHGGGRFDRDHTAVRGFVIACARPHIQNALGVAQGVHDQLVNARVRPTRGRIPNADTLIDLVWGVQSLLL